MWVRRDTWLRAISRAEAAEKLNAALVTRLMNMQPFVVPPPDTAAIVHEAINGVAVIVNGWKETAVAGLAGQLQTQPQLSMDAMGLDNRGGVPENMDDFIPPWEQMDSPARAGWINPPQNGNYTPYVPGQGNTVPPEGGVE